MATKAKTKTTAKKSNAEVVPEVSEFAPQPAAEEAEPEVAIAAARPENLSDVVRKPQFIERVVERSEMRKREVKPALEAALAVLAEAIANGEELVLPPLGKVKVIREKEFANGSAYTIKVRIPNYAENQAANADASDADADEDEDDTGQDEYDND